MVLSGARTQDLMVVRKSAIPIHSNGNHPKCQNLHSGYGSENGILGDSRDSGADRDPPEKDPGRPHVVDRDTNLQLFLKILEFFFTIWEASDSALNSIRDSRVFILDSRLSTLDSSPSTPDSPL